MTKIIILRDQDNEDNKMITFINRKFLTILILLIVNLILDANIARGDNSLNKLLDVEKRLIETYGKAVPAVVNVSNFKQFKDIFFGDSSTEQVGAGSGFIWDNQGHIVTNYHVVEDAKSQFMISFFKNKKQIQAKIIGVDPKYDIAVLKVDKLPNNATPIMLGTSHDLKVGQITIALGNPFGLEYTMTKGIVSALGRKLFGAGGVKINDMIQTDADINPGNSGGPLLNSNGELIGMNTMIYSSSGSSAGLGFAIPIDTIKRIVPDLIKYGKVIRPALGIVPLPEQYMQQISPDEKGVMIAYIPENSNAEKAGLKGMRKDRYGQIFSGDIIQKIDQKEIEGVDDIFNYLDGKKIGDQVSLQIKRANKKILINVTLQSN